MQKLVTGFGTACRQAGQALDKMGAAFEVAPYVEHRKFIQLSILLLV